MAILHLAPRTGGFLLPTQLREEGCQVVEGDLRAFGEN